MCPQNTSAHISIRIRAFGSVSVVRMKTLCNFGNQKRHSVKILIRFCMPLHKRSIVRAIALHRHVLEPLRKLQAKRMSAIRIGTCACVFKEMQTGKPVGLFFSCTDYRLICLKTFSCVCLSIKNDTCEKQGNIPENSTTR